MVTEVLTYVLTYVYVHTLLGFLLTFLTKLPQLGSSYGTRVAYLSTLLQVTVVNNVEDVSLYMYVCTYVYRMYMSSIVCMYLYKSTYLCNSIQA